MHKSRPMLLLPLLLAGAALLPAALGNSCGNPNSTATEIHFYNCKGGDAIKVTAVTVTDDQGVANYPIDVTKPIVLHATSTYTGTAEVKSLLNDAKLAGYFKLPFGKCSWHTIPTFGFLNNICQCGNCPFKPGPLQVDYKIDLSKYSSIIATLAGDTTYLLEVHMKDGGDAKCQGGKHLELGCLTVQLKMKK